MATYTVTVRLRNRASGAQSSSFTVNYGVGDTPAPLPPPTGPALISASFSVNTGETFSQALARTDAAIGPLDAVRIYSSALPEAWSGSRAEAAQRPVILSFKALPSDVNAGKHDAFFQSWFASLPKDTYEIFWCYYHAPEDNIESGVFTAADFREAFRRLAGLAGGAANPNLYATLILDAETADPASGRTFTNFYPGADVIDVLAWNNLSTAGTYETPDALFGKAIALSDTQGKPWGISEVGATKASTDASGSGRASWIESVRNYMSVRRPVFVSYWNQTTSTNDYRLSDSPSQSQWKAYATDTKVTSIAKLGWSPPNSTVADMDAMLTKYPNPKVVRLYSGSGAGIQSWTGSLFNKVPRDATLIYSIKDWPLGTNLATWLSSRPADWTTPFYFCWAHEPEQGTANGDPAPADYQQGWKDIIAQLAGHPRRSEIILVPVFTEYYAKRNETTWWRDFGIVTTYSGIGAVGFDYYDTGYSSYRTAVERNEFPLKIARRSDVQKPVVIAEWGIARKSSDTTGSLAAQAMRDNMNYLRQQADVKPVSWFYRGDCILDDRAPEKQAFIDLMALNT